MNYQTPYRDFTIKTYTVNASYDRGTVEDIEAKMRVDFIVHPDTADTPGFTEVVSSECENEAEIIEEIASQLIETTGCERPAERWLSMFAAAIMDAATEHVEDDDSLGT